MNRCSQNHVCCNTVTGRTVSHTVTQLGLKETGLMFSQSIFVVTDTKMSLRSVPLKIGTVMISMLRSLIQDVVWMTDVWSLKTW